MKLLAVLLLLALVCPWSASSALTTSLDRDLDFIQGTWRAEGTDPTGRHGWYQTWNFDKGKFKHEGYPPLNQEGKYRLLKKVKNKLTLELYDQSGTFGTENSQIEILINKKGTLMIKGQGPFRRVIERSNY